MRGKSTLGISGRMLLAAAILEILLCENSRLRSKIFSLVTYNTPTVSVS